MMDAIRRVLCIIVVLLSLVVVSSSIDSGGEAKDHLVIFVHADWGIGGYDGSQSSSRRSLEVEGEEDDADHERLLGGGGGQARTYYQHKTAASMVTYASTYGSPDAVFAMGDNFYTKGVASPMDSMYTTHFSKLYQADAVMSSVPWYTVPGNHDFGYGWETVSYAQGPARGKVDPNWKTKGTNYTETFAIPGGGQLAVVFTDTTTLSPQSSKFTNENSGVSTDTQYARAYDQMIRLVAYYEAAQGSEWILTLGHYPIFSRGDHSDNTNLQKLLLPLIEKYHSQAYMCGHDHISMHLQYNNTEFFVTGASAMNDQVKSTSTAKMIWAGESYSAFIVMKVWRDKISYDYINNDNQVVYSYSQTNAHKSSTPAPSPLPGSPTLEPTAVGLGGSDARAGQSGPSTYRAIIIVGSVVSFLSLAALGLYSARCGFGGQGKRHRWGSSSSRRSSRLSQAALSSHGGGHHDSGKSSRGSHHGLPNVNINAAQAQSEAHSEARRQMAFDDTSDLEGNLIPRVFSDPGMPNEDPMAKIRREIASPAVEAKMARAFLASPLSPPPSRGGPLVLSGKGGHRVVKSTPF